MAASIDTIKTNKFLDLIINHLCLKNDAALARALDVSAAVISKMRHGKLPFGATMVIRAHYLTDWTVKEILAQLPTLRGTKD